MPPYIVKFGKVIIPSTCTVDIFLRKEHYKRIEIACSGGVRGIVGMELFQLRALARNKGAKADVYIQANHIGERYKYISENKEQKTIDVTDQFKPNFSARAAQ